MVARTSRISARSRRQQSTTGLSISHLRALLLIHIFIVGIFAIAEDPFPKWSYSQKFSLPSSPSLELRSTETSWHEVAPGDTLGLIFNLNNLDFKVIQDILSLRGVENLRKPIVGDRIAISRQEGVLSSVSLQRGPAYKLTVERDGNGAFVISEHRLEPRRYLIAKEVLLQNSLFEDAIATGIPEQIVDDLGKLLGWGIDIAKDLQLGGRLRVVYEGLYYDGVLNGTGDILFFQYLSQGTDYSVVRFVHQDTRKVEYYTEGGRNIRTAFLRTPVKNFIRISSHYDLQRKHPILHKLSAHKGVDYAAPIGSEVQAAGDGRVIFAGFSRGFGNLIVIEHPNGYRTRYGHLNGFARGIIEKTLVRQGQTIGYVGETGLSTGPHLHYEFLVNGDHVDPVEVILPPAPSVVSTELGLVEINLKQFRSFFDLVPIKDSTIVDG